MLSPRLWAKPSARRHGLASITVSEKTLKAIASALAILVLLLLALIAYPSSPPKTTSTSSSPETITSSSSPKTSVGLSSLETTTGSSSGENQAFLEGEQVLALVGQFSNALSNRSVQALGNFYSSTSVTNWHGNAQALTNGGASLEGTYAGQKNISSLFSSFIGRTSSPWFERLSNTKIQVESDTVNSTSDLSFFGINEAGSVFNLTARIQQEWGGGGGESGWHIQAEAWDFVNASVLSPAGSAWTAGEGNPANVQGEACTTVADETYDSGLGVIVEPNVLGGDYVFCVGGSLEGQADAPASYFAEVPSSSNGDLGPWTATTPYPIAAAHPSCVAYVQSIFCVGGAPAGGATNAVYAAPISPSGLGAWENIGPYPLSISDTSCVLRPTNSEGSLPYMVCIGGREANGTETDAVYGAELYPGNTLVNTGDWTALLPPYPTPVEGAGCLYDYGIYCVGGTLNGSYLTETFTIGAIEDGKASWSQYASYPSGVSGESCASGGIKNSVYCVGGIGVGGTGGAAVYYTSRISGTWSAASWFPGRPYPGQFDGGSCFFGNDTITLYCIAGNQVEYAQVLSNSTSP